jgi:integrase
MSRQVERLTTKFVRQIDKPGIFTDGLGLSLAVWPKKDGTGVTKSWTLRYRRKHLGDRPRVMGLGSVHDVDLAEARELARDARKLIRQGIDPIEARRKERSEQAAATAKPRVPTFEKMVKAFIGKERSGWRSRKHEGQVQLLLEKHAKPLAKLAVDEITQDHVIAVLMQDGLWSKRHVTASRLRALIERVLGYAGALKHRDGLENPATLEKLREIMPKMKKVENHYRALDHRQVNAFWTALRSADLSDRRLDFASPMSALALQFLVLTAARTGEVLKAEWSEVDLNARTWTIPASKMKANRTHVVPLSAPAIAILEGIKRSPGVNLIFVNPEGKPLPHDAFRRLVMQKIGYGHVTTHGMRACFRSWAAANNVSRETAELALAHRLGDATEQSYNRDSLLEARAKVMSDWADRCASPDPVAQVVVLKPKAA